VFKVQIGVGTDRKSRKTNLIGTQIEGPSHFNIIMSGRYPVPGSTLMRAHKVGPAGSR
jgi:hypothetical protein